jgi:hypothetical protein
MHGQVKHPPQQTVGMVVMVVEEGIPHRMVLAE